MLRPMKPPRKTLRRPARRTRRAIDESAARALARALTAVRRPAEMRRMMDEILTPAEVRDLSLRWKLLHMLCRGMTQRAISGALGVSLCKITRGSRVLKGKRSVAARLLRRGSGAPGRTCG
jgi:TrpR family trp operon transcriptional repressor